MKPTVSMIVLALTALVAAAMSLLARRALRRRNGNAAGWRTDAAALRAAVGWDVAALSVMLLGGVAAGLVATT